MARSGWDGRGVFFCWRQAVTGAWRSGATLTELRRPFTLPAARVAAWRDRAQNPNGYAGRVFVVTPTAGCRAVRRSEREGWPRCDL